MVSSSCTNDGRNRCHWTVGHNFKKEMGPGLLLVLLLVQLLQLVQLLGCWGAAAVAVALLLPLLLEPPHGIV